MKGKVSRLLLALFLVFSAVAGFTSCSSPDDGGDKSPGRESEAVDVDLTVLGSTMVYAEVYSMMSHPDEYMGKTIKVKGPYRTTFYEPTGLFYHFIVIEDATACCAQGLEFVISGEGASPSDYPEETADIELIGLFDCYEELGEIYYYLSTEGYTVLQ